MSHHLDHQKPVPEGSVLARSSWDTEMDAIFFWCPGCQGIHQVTINPEHPNSVGACWRWNGDYIKPTIEPSILLRSKKFTEKGNRDYEAWYDSGFDEKLAAPKDEGFESVPTVCHSFVRDGMIQFLGDCTHALANQTVPLPVDPLNQPPKT